MSSVAAVRVLVTGINSAPENICRGKHTGELCDWLARGHSVRIEVHGIKCRPIRFGMADALNSEIPQ